MENLENLTELENDALSAPFIVQCLSSRFKAKKPVTMVGDCAIYVNPMHVKEHEKLYEHLDKVFAIADRARNCAANDNSTQSVILRGQSGSGKTELAKVLIQRLLSSSSSTGTVVECKSKEGYQPLGSKANPFVLPVGATKVHRALIAAVSTLDMFGMAPTSYAVDAAGAKDYHAQSSRQARLFSFTMESENPSALIGFRVDSAAFDTIRLHNFKDAAFAPYRIFGSLVGSFSTSATTTKPSVPLTPTQTQNVLQHFGAAGADMASLSVQLSGELEHYRQVLLTGAGVTVAEWDQVVNCLMAVVQLQAITVTGSDSTPGRIANSANMLCLSNTEALLGIPAGDLAKLLTQFPNPNNASAFIDYKKFEVIAQIDGMCVEIYQRVMNWLLDKCNIEGAVPGLGPEDTAPAAYNIVDLVGWENNGNNINGFAQLQANSQMERLNQIFAAQCIQGVVDSYVTEGIPIDSKLVVVPSIAPVVELCEASVTGVFSSLEGICLLPKGDEKALVEKLEQSHRTKTADLITFLPAGSTGSASVAAAKYSNALIARPGSSSAKPTAPAAFSTIFSVNHACGAVTYDVDKFVTINKSYASNEVLKVLAKSATGDTAIVCLKPGKGSLMAEDETLSSSATPAVGSVKSKFAAFSAAKAGVSIPIKRGNLFLTRAKTSFDVLMESVETTKCHFIQCIRPGSNPMSGVAADVAFNADMVTAQVKGLHVLELCMLSKAASYPYQVTYGEFFGHFRPMIPFKTEPELPWLLETSDDTKANSICRDLFKRILVVAGLPEIAPIAAGMQINETGPKRDMIPVFAKNKVFMKNAIFTPLNSYRNDLLDRMLMAGVLVQRLYRWWKAYKIIKFKIVVPYKHLRPGFYGTIAIAQKASMKHAFRCIAVKVRESRTLVIKKSLAVLVYMDRLRRRYDEIRIDLAARLIQNTFNQKFIFQIKFQRLKKAARMMQFLAKGYAIRRETMNIVFAARCIRKNLSFFGLKLRKIKQRITAAQTIQSCYRGWFEREKFSRIVRILAAKKRLRIGRRCVLKLQSTWRKRSIYQRFNMLRWAALAVQRWARSLQHRRRFLLVCMLAQWLQTHARRLVADRRVDVLRSIAACAMEKRVLTEYRKQELLSSNISTENLVINNKKQELHAPGGSVMDKCIIGEGVLKDGQLYYSRCVAAVDVEDYVVAEAYPEGWLTPMRKFAHELTARDKKHVVHVAIGTAHTVAIDEDSNIYTMGSSEFGQLGHGTRKNVPYYPKAIVGIRETLSAIDGVGSAANGGARAAVPASVKPMGGGMRHSFVVKQLACGPNYTMILSAAGKVYSWGANDRGQLGYGDFQDAVTPHCVSALKNIAKIACGAGHAAALTHSGAVYTWGAWDCIGRALGRDASYAGAQPTLFAAKGSNTPAAAEPAPLPKMNRRVSMFLAKKKQEDAEAREKSQKNMVAIAKANAKRRASTTTIAGNKVATSTMLDASKVVHKDTCEPGLVNYFQHRGIKGLVCGDTHTAVLHVEGNYGGTVYCWGKNTYGEIGQGAPEPETFVLPKRVASLPSMKETDALMSSLYCGGNTMGFLLKGKLYMWGWNKYGQVGVGPHFECVYEPVEVAIPVTRNSEMVTHVTMNRRQSVAMTNYGAVHVWGYINGLFENPVGTYNAVQGNVGTPAPTSMASSTSKIFGGSMNKLFGGDDQISVPAPGILDMHPRGRGGATEITATSDDLKKCVYSPTLWSSSAGMVESSLHTATGMGSRSPAKRTITRPSELSSASVSNSGREGGYGAIFAFLPGMGVCSSSSMSILAFDRIKGIPVDPKVLQELSGKRHVSSREVHALPGQFHSSTIGSSAPERTIDCTGSPDMGGPFSPSKSRTAPSFNENSTIGFANTAPMKSPSRPGTATTRPGTANATMRPATSTGVSSEAPRTTCTTAMHIVGGKGFVSDNSKASGEFQAEMSRRFKESLKETIAGKVVRRFSNADSLADSAKMAQMQASNLSSSGASHLARDAVANKGGHHSDNPYGGEESDILQSITTNKPMFGATAPQSKTSFSSSSGGVCDSSSFWGGGTFGGVKGYDRSREGKLAKAGVTDLLVPTKALSISSSNAGSKPATTGAAPGKKLTTDDLSVSKNKIPFSNSSTSSRAVPAPVSPVVDKKSLLTSFAQRLHANSSPAPGAAARSRSGSGVTISSSSKQTAKISRPAPKLTPADKIEQEMRAAEAELELMFKPNTATATASAAFESVNEPVTESVPESAGGNHDVPPAAAALVDAAGPEWAASPTVKKKKSVTGSNSSVYTAQSTVSKTSSTGATINTYTNYNYNVNKQKQ